MPLIADLLRALPRRYRIPDDPASCAGRGDHTGAATALACTIAYAAASLALADIPDAATRHAFLGGLARLIREALRADTGDFAFQAMVLHHRDATVREYASLLADADKDARRVRAVIDAIAHPGKLARMTPSAARKELARLHAAACAADWATIRTTTEQVLAAPHTDRSAPVWPTLTRLLNDPALERLQRVDTLRATAQVRHYLSLWERDGPRSGTEAAVARAAEAQQRGAAVEAAAAQALWGVAAWLTARDVDATYRVATALQVPASIVNRAAHAKTEWDAVLLRSAPPSTGDADAWDVCLLVEAKASADAATTDFARLQRGLHLLVQADPGRVYAFASREGVIQLRGASLRALPAHERDLDDVVLYCSDAPADPPRRLLSAASRMRLLCAPPSLNYAARLADDDPVAAEDLAPVWDALIDAPDWAPVLHQYSTMVRVRRLMVHVDDLTDLSNKSYAKTRHAETSARARS